MIGDECDADMVFARIDSVRGSCEIAAGQDDSVLLGEQAAGELRVRNRGFQPEIEPTVRQGRAKRCEQGQRRRELALILDAVLANVDLVIPGRNACG